MKRFVFLLSAVAAVFLSVTAFAEEFAADMVSTADSGSFTARIFVGKDKTRIDSPESVVITRIDKKVVWMLMPDRKMYMEQPFDPNKVAATSEKVEGEVERIPLGKDNVDGKSADKYKVVYRVKGTENSVYQWIDPSLALPVKTAAIDGSWMMEYKNIEKGPQPDSLFEIPAGYNKLEMPDMGNMMKGMMNDKE